MILSKDLIPGIWKAIQISFGNQRRPFIESDQFFQRAPAVPDNYGEDFLGHCKDFASLCAWQAVVENSYFFLVGNVSLQNEIVRHPRKVIAQMCIRFDDLETSPALTDVRFQHNRILHFVLFAESAE